MEVLEPSENYITTLCETPVNMS